LPSDSGEVAEQRSSRRAPFSRPSSATAKKHLERIYAKLGVETRTAAGTMVINRELLLQPQHGG